MPYKSEKINISNTMFDRRRKLTDTQKQEIKELYSSGFHSLNSLAKQFGVSKKTILLIVNKNSKAKNDKRIKEHWRDYQKFGKEHAQVMREHRQYKQQLYLKGEIQ